MYALLRDTTLAQGRDGIFIGTELTWNVTYLGVIVFGIQEYGLVMTDMGFWIACLIYYGVVALVAARLIGYKSIWRNWMFMLPGNQRA